VLVPDRLKREHRLLAPVARPDNVQAATLAEAFKPCGYPSWSLLYEAAVISRHARAFRHIYNFLRLRYLRLIVGLHRPSITWVKRRTTLAGVPRHYDGNPMPDYARLLETQIPRLRRYARALTRGDVERADDLVQNCLIRAVAKEHLWQPGTDLRAWLFTILHNQFVNAVRCSAREGIKVEIDEVTPILPALPNAMPALELRDLEIALRKLPDEQRQVILLVGLEGMTYEEVASILQIPVGTVRSRISRGRDQLRRLMGMVDEELSPNPAKSAAAVEREIYPRAA
jgi:RNA polymerase sigma-70 factor, ECF subfamily